jgi:hypothetical protein
MATQDDVKQALFDKIAQVAPSMSNPRNSKRTRRGVTSRGFYERTRWSSAERSAIKEHPRQPPPKPGAGEPMAEVGQLTLTMKMSEFPKSLGHES